LRREARRGTAGRHPGKPRGPRSLPGGHRMSAVLEVNELRVFYRKVEALHRVSLRVEEGTIVTVIGPNGAGKTTLLGAIMGMLPSTGAIRYLGADLSVARVEARVARGLCRVPERRELCGELSVEDNLRLGAFQRARHGGRGAGSDRGGVHHRVTSPAERRTPLAATLAGGERQMLALGRALIRKPRLLMRDEPSLGLAPRIVREIMQIVAGPRRTGVSILRVEQSARAALQVADYG